jgi:flagellar motor protein MotB
MSVAWIAYADFLASMAVVFLALFLGRRHSVDVILTNPPPGQVSVSLGKDTAEVVEPGKRFRLQIAQDVSDSLKVLLRVKVDNEPEVPLWATIGLNTNTVSVDYRSRDQLVLELNDSQPNFETGTAVLQAQALQLLRDSVLAQCTVKGKYPFLRARGKGSSSEMLMVCGYADGQRFVELGTGADRNWRLSYERALAVRDYLVNQGGCDPDRIMVAAFGSHQMRESEGPGLTPDQVRKAQRRNRRVELRIVTDGTSIGAQPDKWTSGDGR